MELEHTFDDIGIGSIKGGWSFGSVSGKCTIDFDEIGDWEITAIEVRISKLINGMWSNRFYLLDKESPDEQAHFHLVRKAIEEFEKAEIVDAISEAMPLTYEPQSMFKHAGRSM